MELNNLGAYIIPDSISYTITQDKAMLQFDFVDYTYGEYNKRIMAFYKKKNKTYDVLQISGYKDCIDKNKDMIDRILKSAKVK
jgi:bifunctional ADP-heptose synthase (sugar kinase/adenylyltransferase)